MQISPAAEIAALVITVLVHIIGAGILIWAMLDGEGRDGLRNIWPRDDDGGSRRPRWPVAPPRGGDGVPLLDESRPARVRLRGPGRLSDAIPAPPRRPEHDVPAPDREPAHR